MKIPDSVEQIGDDCFVNCARLTKLIVPDSVKSIGNGCLSGCCLLTNVRLPVALTIFLSNDLFSGCTSLREVKIGEFTNVLKFTKNIGARCFEGCESLEEIYVNGEASIGEEAFGGCTGLASLPSYGEVSIGEEAFGGCKRFASSPPCGLAMPIIKGKIKRAAKNIFPTSWIIKVHFPYNFVVVACLDTVVIPFFISKLPNRSFFHCSNIRRVLFLSSKFKSLGDDCFNGCSKLETINLPEKIKWIGNECFKDCYNLDCPWLVFTSSGDMFIGKDAFRNCSSVQSLSVSFSALRPSGCFEGTEMLPQC
jgi:hypothetical protein